MKTTLIIIILSIIFIFMFGLLANDFPNKDLIRPYIGAQMSDVNTSDVTESSTTIEINNNKKSITNE